MRFRPMSGQEPRLEPPGFTFSQDALGIPNLYVCCFGILCEMFALRVKTHSKL